MCRYEDKPSYTYTFHQRKVGYLSGMASAGLEVDELTVECNSDTESPVPTYDDAIIRDLTMLSERILKMDPPPTAVIAGNDLMACVLVDVLKRHGFIVPEDMSVIGYDGWNKLAPVSASGFIPTSTMVVNWREMGREASELALSMQFGAAQTPRYLEVPAVYEDYGTVAPPKT
jgi:DNA-binding LacI/PurR family transcriptional regulator